MGEKVSKLGMRWQECSSYQFLRDRTYYSTPITFCRISSGKWVDCNAAGGTCQAVIPIILTESGLAAAITSKIRCYGNRSISKEFSYIHGQRTLAGTMPDNLCSLSTKSRCNRHRNPTPQGPNIQEYPRSCGWRCIKMSILSIYM